MGKRRKLATGILTVFSWSILGGLVGLGGSYFVYVKKPAVFESVAIVEIARAPLGMGQRASGAVEERVEDHVKKRGIGSDRSIADVDDSILLRSDAVVAGAVRFGRLERLPELRDVPDGRGNDVDEVAMRISSSGNLVVQPIGPSSTGRVYSIAYRAALPSSSQDVVTALLFSAQKEIEGEDVSNDWPESVKLLTSSRRQIEDRIQQLESERNELSTPASAFLKDGAVASPASEQWQRLRMEAYTLQAERAALDRKIRQCESLIAQGAPKASILQSLGQAVRIERPAVSILGASDRASQASQSEARRLRSERNAALVAEVEKEVAPLQRELEMMLQKLGPRHPTVVFVRSKIAKAKAKLREISVDAGKPLPEAIEMTPPTPLSEDPEAPSDESTPTDESTLTDGQRINSLLKAVRDQREKTSQELVSVSSQLEKAAGEVAKQEAALLQQKKLVTELARQQELGAMLVERLHQLSASSPFPEIKFNVLKGARPGIQVEPLLVPHLLIGGLSGLIAGTVLSCLMLLTAATARYDS